MMTSFWNRNDYRVFLYYDSHYRGRMVTIPPGGSISAIATQHNDKMTSWKAGVC